MKQIVRVFSVVFMLIFVSTVQAQFLKKKKKKAGYESVTTDGIHLTEYGNEIIAGAWLQLFEKIKDGD